MSTVIKNGLVLRADCSGFEKLDILIDNDKIVNIGKSLDSENIIDATGKYVIPGFIDIHNHGSVGVNFCKDKVFDEALIYSAKHGVTSVAITISTRPLDDIIAQIQVVKSMPEIDCAAASVDAIHIEGPFIAASRKGAMISPDSEATVDNFRLMADAAGELLKVMTIAPDRENAPEIIKEGVCRGIRMSIGHTDADYETAMKAIDAGATGATHTFNAMRPLNHRDPGVLGAVLTDGRVVCEVICDMVHLHSATVKLIYSAKGRDRMIFVSDAGYLSGLGDGIYGDDGKVRISKDGVIKNQDGVIAGSAYIMTYGAKRLLELGISLADVSAMGSRNPARELGLLDKTGTLECGKRADIIVCDEKLEISAVFAAGKRAV